MTGQKIQVDHETGHTFIGKNKPIREEVQPSKQQVYVGVNGTYIAKKPLTEGDKKAN